MRRAIAIVIASADAATVAEAWRAAVGVSLRGARVAVATAAGSADGGPAASRARSTLALFGHDVAADAAAVAADAAEIWRGPAPVDLAAAAPHAPRLHLVRAGRAPGAVAAGDRVLQLTADVDHAAVLDAVAAAGATWVW